MFGSQENPIIKNSRHVPHEIEPDMVLALTRGIKILVSKILREVANPSCNVDARNAISFFTDALQGID